MVGLKSFLQRSVTGERHNEMTSSVICLAHAAIQAQSAHMSTPLLLPIHWKCCWIAAADSSSIYCNPSASLHLL